VSGGQAAQAGGGSARPATPARRAILARLLRPAGAVLAAATVSFAGIGSHSLWTPDEPRDAAIGKAMWASGDLVMPRLNGSPFLEKPPLAWWAQAAAFRALGVSDAVARVAPACFATLTLLVAFALGRRLGGPRAGWLAAGALASAAEFSEDMGRAIVDPALVLMVTLAYAGFVVLVTPRPRAEEAGGIHPAAGRESRGIHPAAGLARWGACLLIAAAVPLAFLAKGIVGIGLALGPPVLYLLATARRRTGSGDAAGAAPAPARQGLRETARLLAPLALLGAPLFAAIVLPWALALLHEGGWAALRECLVGNTVGRLLSTEAGRAYGHRQPFWYYLPAGAAALLPWSLALPAMLRGGGSSPASAPRGASVAGESAGAGSRLLTACFFIGVLLLSLAASKRALYLVPLLPAIAVPIGLWLDRVGRGGPRSRWDRPSALLMLGLAALLPAVLWIGAWEGARGAFRSFPAAPLRAELSGGRLAAAGAAAAAVGVLLLFRLARHLRTGTTPTGTWLVLPYLALALVYQTAVKAAVDPLKNLHDLTAAVARLDPGAGPVAAYRPSETTLGIVDFDLGRQVEAVAGPAELAALVGARPAGRLVLSVDAWRRLPAPLRAHLQLLYDETATKASPFAVAAWSDLADSSQGTPAMSSAPAREPGAGPSRTFPHDPP
jgi:4-amino-4-deoxy-L-arabinose transferase-like glycosyltransferase